MQTFTDRNTPYHHHSVYSHHTNQQNIGSRNPHLLHPNYNPYQMTHTQQSISSFHPKPIHQETGMIIHNDDEITKFHSNFKYSKPLLPNLHPPTQHTHSTDMIIEEDHSNENIQPHPSSSEYINGKIIDNDQQRNIKKKQEQIEEEDISTSTNTTTHLNQNGNDNHRKQQNDDYFVPQQYQYQHQHTRTTTTNSMSISALSGAVTITRKNEDNESSSSDIHHGDDENISNNPHKKSKQELSQSRSVLDIMNENNNTRKKASNLMLQESKSVPVELEIKDEDITRDTKRGKQQQNHKTKTEKKTKRLKHELSNMKSNYHAMLKDYNNLQNFLSRKGIQYDPTMTDIDNGDENENGILMQQQMESLKKQKLEIEQKYINLENENENLKSMIDRLQQQLLQKDEIINKLNRNNIYLSTNSNGNNKAATPSLDGSIVIHDTPNHHDMNVSTDYSPISPLADDNNNNDNDDHKYDISSSSDDDGSEDMLKRIFQGSDDDDFYAELTTLYDFKQNSHTASVLQLKELDIEYDSDGEDFHVINNGTVRQKTASILDILQLSSYNSSNLLLNKRASNSYQSSNRNYVITDGHDVTTGRRRAQSNSLLPVNSVVELQKEENIILQNEFDLFRLLIDDQNDEKTKILNLTLKKRRGSVNLNYLGIDALIDHVCNPQFDIDTLCNFLPLILFKASKCEKEITSKSKSANNKKNKKGAVTKTNASLVLISRLSKEDRLWEHDDIRQKLQFLSNAFGANTTTKNKDKHNKKNKDKKDHNNPIKDIFDHSHKIWLKKQTEKLISSSNSHSSKSATLTDLSYDISAVRKLDGDDLIIFWENIMDLEEQISKFINPEQCSFHYRDPVNPGLPPLRKVKVCKQLKSANKPILCELWVENNDNNYQQKRKMSDINEMKVSNHNQERNRNKQENINNNLMLSSHVILKKGDDLRKDYAIMNIFKYMNYIWKKERDNTFFGEFKNLQYEGSIVKILTFNVVPFNDEFGAIELIANCVPLRHVNYLKKDMKNEHFYQLITSAAASYIGAFVCGIRDRHFENILIRVADCTLFHIDFGYCVGEKIKFAIDASPFGITNQLKELMNYGNDTLYKDKFVPIAIDSYMALRKNYKSLIKFAQLAFSYIKKEKDIENFIKDRLKIFDNDKKKEKKWNEKYVKQWLRKQLLTAPKDTKTIRKNKLRKFLSPTMVDIDQKLKEDEEKRKNQSKQKNNQ